MIQKPCESFYDQLSGEVRATPELQDHLLHCPTCRERRNALAEMKIRAGGVCPPASDDLKKSITEYVVTHSNPMTPGPVPGPGPLPFITAAVAGVFCLILFFLQPETSQDRYRLKMPGEAEKTFQIGIPIAIETGTAEAIGPDGSRLEISGKTFLLVFRRGFEIAHGNVRSTVMKGPGTFTVKTPQGLVEAIGTIFSCRVDGFSTFVQVTEGRVRVQPHDEPEIFLGPSQEARFGVERASGVPSLSSGTMKATDTELLPAPVKRVGSFSPDDL